MAANGNPAPVDPAITAAAALADDLRRGMYAYIRTCRRPVTRDEAATAVGISRKLAAFHLDKLVDAGLLRVPDLPAGDTHRVGRRPKTYLPVDTDLRLSIPPRHHDLLADLLLDAVLDETAAEPARDAALRLAREHGATLGEAERGRSRPGRLGAERALTLAAGVLARHGFETTREAPTCLRLRTCPFHPFTARSPELICGLNHAFLTGLLDGLDAGTVAAAPDPEPGACCVRLHQS